MLQEDGKWNKFGGRLPWDKSYICSDNQDYGGTGGRKTGEDYHAAPNIDHNQVIGFRLTYHVAITCIHQCTALSTAKDALNFESSVAAVKQH